MATTSTTPIRERRRRSDGERSYKAIVRGASELATLEGLDGLSIGRLAEHIGMSKSGLYAHFGSKEELQLAAIEEAQEIFEREVGRATAEAPEGLARLLAFVDAYLSYVERRVFPGGCFFASVTAELAPREGRVAETIREFYGEGLDGEAEMVRDAQRRGELDPDLDPHQVAFEVDSLLHGANSNFMLFGERRFLDRARAAIRERLGRPE